MNHPAWLNELLDAYEFDPWEWSADGTASWERTDRRKTAFPRTTRACITRVGGDAGPLVFHLEHVDFRGPFYTADLDRLDPHELDGLLSELFPAEDDEDD